ncbi:MAG: hypothetical protein K940chlam3_00340 [Chlamydiae bacterium]|nr:hypothetical protein [Chlamydiota bacterium]
MSKWIISLLLFLCTPYTIEAWLSEPPIEAQEQVAPYLMPEDHPIKPILDMIFGSSRITTDVNSMKQAGFYDTQLRKRGIVFARHVDTPGYVYKIVCDYSGHSWNKYEDTCRKQDEYIEFTGRIRKRNQITELIDFYQIDNFITPKKWLYPIPTEFEPFQNHTMIKKFYLLVAEDIDIIESPNCVYLWRELPDENLLNSYFLIIRDARLCDIGPPNQSFTKSGQLAFIDTKIWPDENFNINAPTGFLNNEMSAYWMLLVESNAENVN